MAKHVLVLSGQVSVGKTTLAELLASRYGAVHLKTSRCLLSLKPDVPRDRRSMQEAGEALDNETNGEWVLQAFNTLLGNNEDWELAVLDAARIPGQIEALRKGYGSRVVHVHLQATIEELTRRYKERKREDIIELSTYAEVLKNRTERQVEHLANTADLVLWTDRCSPEGVLTRAAAALGYYARSVDQSVDVLIGGQYGSEGKGQVAAYLAPEYDVLVRVGGPNAGHKVWRDPQPLTFHHLPSGTRSNEAAQIVLGPGSVINPDALLKEIAECDLESTRLVIDPLATVITPEDIASEELLRNSIGSTGQGVGAATAARILSRSRPLDDLPLARNCKILRPFLADSLAILEEAYRKGKRVFLEGTQGTGLSLFHGPYPYVTSRDTTVSGCLAEAGISPRRVGRIIMVVRTYPIRVQSPKGGTSGPLEIEIDWNEVAARAGRDGELLKTAEKTSTTKKDRRVGEFEWPLFRKSVSLNAPTDIALTFVDYVAAEDEAARRFEQLSKGTMRLIQEIERVAMAPVSLISTRFHSRAIIDRRHW